MKKIILIIFAWLSLFLVGCDGIDTLTCYRSVQEKYPQSKIKQVPNHKYRFIVKTHDGVIRYIETMNPSSHVISKDVIIFKATK